MTRLCLILIATVALLVPAATAHATTWPADCHTWRCVNRHLNALQRTTVTESRQQSMFLMCLFTYPAEWVSQTTNPYLALAEPATTTEPGTYAFVQLDARDCTL